jgi:hypothetical protein
VWYVYRLLQFNTEYDKEEDIQKLAFKSIRNYIYCKFTCIHPFKKCKFTAERSVIVPDCGMALLSMRMKGCKFKLYEHALIKNCGNFSSSFRSLEELGAIKNSYIMKYAVFGYKLVHDKTGILCKFTPCRFNFFAVCLLKEWM